MCNQSVYAHPLMFAMSLSILGLLMTLTMAISPPNAMTVFPWQNMVTGLIFISICMLGILAAFLPKTCSAAFESHGNEKSRTQTENPCSNLVIKGHHPSCDRFYTHVFSIGGRVLCAACTGLVIGAAGAIPGTYLYFFVGLKFGPTGLPLVAIGELFIVLGFAQLRFKGIIRSALNVFFVLGAFLTLVGTDTAGRSLFLDLYLIGLILLWIWSRTLLSRWDHFRICCECRLSHGLKEKRN
jgi:hypothetical protein